MSAAWSGKQEEEEEEEEESVGCPGKLKSSSSRFACSPMPGRGTRVWVFLGSDAASRVGLSLRRHQLQRWAVVVGVSQLGTGVLGSPGSPPARTDRQKT